MNKHKYTLDTNILPNIYPRLLFITDSYYKNTGAGYLHSHNYAEVFYVQDGSGMIQIENNEIPVHANTLVIISPYTQHSDFIDIKQPLTYYSIGVQGLKNDTSDALDYSTIFTPSEGNVLQQCFENIFTEMQSKKNGYAKICQHYLSILLLHIYRQRHISCEMATTKIVSRECQVVKEYIEKHYTEKITLDKLAEISNLTKYYLSHKFSEVYGKPPITYLTEIRIIAAKNLLRTTDYSIEEIAGATGFSSSSYFSQTFQKICQLSPQQYRKMPG